MENRKKRKRRKKSGYFDYTLLFIVFFLVGFGMVMIYSASSYTAFMEHKGDSAYFLKKQLVAALLGIAAMLIVANIPYHFWERFATLGYVLSVVLIFMVLTPLGVESHGARRWIALPGTGFNLQPAEIAKIAMILFLSVLACKIGKGIQTVRGFLLMLAAPMPVAALIYVITDNLSSAVIVVGISCLMIFVASSDYKKFVLLSIAAGGAGWGVVELLKRSAGKGGFRGARILAWLEPEKYAKTVGFQTLQALYAIGSGGIWGKGLGKSMQKLSFLPESQNDMIFSIICEELGLLGGIAIILMFILLIWRMTVIATKAPDFFGSMMVVGVIGHIAIQAILNIAVVTNTVPNTGISLPFISYGGSSIIFLLIEIGIVLNVAKNMRLKDA